MPMPLPGAPNIEPNSRPPRAPPTSPPIRPRLKLPLRLVVAPGWVFWTGAFLGAVLNDLPPPRDRASAVSTTNPVSISETAKKTSSTGRIFIHTEFIAISFHSGWLDVATGDLQYRQSV